MKYREIFSCCEKCSENMSEIIDPCKPSLASFHMIFEMYETR